MKPFTVVACCVVGLVGTRELRADVPDVLGVTAGLFKEFDKNRSQSLNAAELTGAVDKWKKCVRGRIGGESLKAFEARIAQLNPDGDGNAQVSVEEFRQFAADSLGIPVPPLPGAIPVFQFPIGFGGVGSGDKDRDGKDKDDGDKDKKDRVRGTYGEPQPWGLVRPQPWVVNPSRVPDYRDDRGRGASGGGDKDKGGGNKGGGGGGGGRGGSSGGNSDRGGGGGGNSSRTPSKGGNSRSPVGK